MSRKILVADDSVVIQKSIGITFAQEDFQVMFVGNGDEAYQKSKELNPDLILADTSMPKLSGADLCKKFRQEASFRDTPILLLTSSQETFTPEQLKAMGANDFIQKPFESSLLLEKVKTLFSKSPSAPEPTRSESMESTIENVFAKIPSIPDEEPTPIAYQTKDTMSESYDSGFDSTSSFQEPVTTATKLDDLSVDDDADEIQSVNFTPYRSDEQKSSTIDSSVAPTSQESSNAPMPQLQLSEQQIEQIVTKVFQNVIERIAWEVVPELAERLIKEEIQKVTGE